jgi:hypothetical protein
MVRPSSLELGFDFSDIGAAVSRYTASDYNSNVRIRRNDDRGLLVSDMGKERRAGE